MIRSFADSDAEQIFRRRHSRRHAAFERIAFRKLRQIHSISKLQELFESPGNRLEKRKGHREGQWSLRINDRFQICFRGGDDDAYEVQIVDYHSG
ncbi:MAG TPA: type II toxin-antitoxin system RelE/ParE family toxin [Terracidiphilus sp.]|nr:type II toxin-antitoxin system RelE/ParE family toxin [Terracidiphilus sp.]